MGAGAVLLMYIMNPDLYHVPVFKCLNVVFFYYYYPSRDAGFRALAKAAPLGGR